MENLSTLVKSLSAGEEKLVRHFYKLRDFGEYRKREQLFDLVAAGKAKDENDLARLLGCVSASAAYHNIKSRLKSDIVCVLLMQESSCKFNTQYAQAMFSCRRALLTGEILLSRGVYQEGIALLRKASRLAEKYELYAERIITEDALRNHYAGSNDIKELHSGTMEIDKNYELLGHMMSSKKKLYKTVFADSGSFVEDSPFGYNADQLLGELDKLDTETDSSRVNFYSKLSRLNVLHSRGELAKAIECAKELLIAAEEDPILTSSANQAGIHLEIANMYLRSGSFTEAELHACTAVKLFKPGMLNHMRACTIVFYAQVHAQKYTQAESSLKTVLTSRCLKEPAYEILRNRILLVSAWFSFARGKYEPAATALKQCNELSKEKGAWLCGYSLMESLLLIEKGAYDAAIYKLDALRKSVARTPKDSTINRTLIIITVLRHLIRSNNDYEETSKLASKEIIQLGQPSAEAAWDPTGFEIVPIDQMIRIKMKKTMRSA